MLQVIAGLDGKENRRGQRVLEGRESGDAALAGSGSSYWSEAGSAGGKRELHSRRNNMAQSETTSIIIYSLLLSLRTTLNYILKQYYYGLLTIITTE